MSARVPTAEKPFPLGEVAPAPPPKLVDLAELSTSGIDMDCPAAVDGWMCTLDKDHEGPHAAHSPFGLEAVWFDDGRGFEL